MLAPSATKVPVDVTRYREARDKASLKGEELSYHHSFCVGPGLYQFQAAALKPGSRVRPRHLKLNIPDTITYGVNTVPKCYYTNEDGFVVWKDHLEEWDRFTKHLKHNLPVAAVKKQPQYIQGTRVIAPLGNVTTTMSARGLQDKSEPSPGEVFVIQAFVKSRGPHAYIIRQMLHHNKPATAWMISNKRKYIQQDSSPSQDAQHNTLDTTGAFLTETATDMSCSISFLPSRSCLETAALTECIKEHFEALTRSRLAYIVADFTRDDKNKLWCLQVKAFRFVQASPSHPFKLTSQRRRVICFKDRASSDSEGDSDSTSSDDKPKQECRVEARGTSRRLQRCGLCQASYPQHWLSFKLTKNMIDSTVTHLRGRLTQQELPTFLRAETGEYMRAAVRADPLKARDGYREHRVCDLCCELHLQEEALAKAASRLNKTCNTRAWTAAPRCLTAKQRLLTHSMLPPRLGLCRFLVVLHEVFDLPNQLLDPISREVLPHLAIQYKLAGRKASVPLKTDWGPIDRSGSTTVPLNMLRVHDCFVSVDDTMALDKEQEPSQDQVVGFHGFISRQSSFHVYLISSAVPPCEPSLSYPDRPPRWCAEATIPLDQFRSSCVTGQKMVVPFTLRSDIPGGEPLPRTLLRATVCVARRGDVDTFALPQPLLLRNGAVISPTWCSSDPLTMEFERVCSNAQSSYFKAPASTCSALKYKQEET